ncbi:MAG: DUF6680 family protein [Nitrospira sp.]
MQAESFLQRRRERRQRKLEVFRTLMANRAAGLSPAHVEALNRIDIEFHDERRITDAWKAYLDHLNDRSLNPESWGTRTQDLLVELLYAMGQSLGYEFDRVHIKRAAYYPQGYGDLEQDQLVIRKGLAAVLRGERALPMEVTALPVSQQEAQEQAELRKLMIQSYSGQLPLEVKLVKTDEPQGGA